MEILNKLFSGGKPKEESLLIMNRELKEMDAIFFPLEILKKENNLWCYLIFLIK